MSVSGYKVGVEHVAYYTGCARRRGSRPQRRIPSAVHRRGGLGTVDSSHSGPSAPPGHGGARPGDGGPGGAGGVGSPLVGYYTGREGELAGRWASAGAMEVRAGGVVTPSHLQASLSVVDPDTGERLGRRYKGGGTFVDRLGVTRPRHSQGDRAGLRPDRGSRRKLHSGRGGRVPGRDERCASCRGTRGGYHRPLRPLDQSGPGTPTWTPTSWSTTVSDATTASGAPSTASDLARRHGGVDGRGSHPPGGTVPPPRVEPGPGG